MNSITQMKWTNSLKARTLDSPWIAISLCKQWFSPWLHIGITWNPWLALSVWPHLRHFYVIGMGSTCGQDTQVSPNPEVLWRRWYFPALTKSFSWSVFQQLKSVTSPQSQCLELTLIFIFILRNGKTFNSQQQDTLLPKWKGRLWACVWYPGEGILRNGPSGLQIFPRSGTPSRQRTCLQRVKSHITGHWVPPGWEQRWKKKKKGRTALSAVVYP